jgi:CRISPR/Cas system-associated exonuclease Cas4 (RecB family)
MLAEAVLASFGNSSSRSGFSVTSISQCPYQSYLRVHKLTKRERKPSEYKVMEDGNWQEKKMVAHLRQAGFKLTNVLSEQLTIHVGRARIIGHPDGLITVGGKEDLLEMKAMSLDRYTTSRQKGPTAFHYIYSQIQLYMASDELRDKVDGCWLFIEHKDTCRNVDFYVAKDFGFSTPLIEMTDKIYLDNFIPDKVECDLCANCDDHFSCWEKDTFDMSKSKVITEDVSQSVEQWRQGKFYMTYGKALNEEARDVLLPLLGDNDIAYVENLELKRIPRRTVRISEKKFVDVFGASRLPEILEEDISSSVRIREV